MNIKNQQLTSFVENIEDVDVTFIRIHNKLAWFCDWNGLRYGAYTTMKPRVGKKFKNEVVPLEDLEDHMRVFRINAKESLVEIKKC